MSETEANLTPADRELEGALGGLAPAPADIHLVSLAFAAGRRSTRLRLLAWRAAAAGLAVALGASALVRPEPRVAERFVVAPAPPADVSPARATPVRSAPVALDPRSASSVSPLPQSYLFLRDTVLARGLGVLPRPAPANSAPRPQVVRAADIYNFGEQL